MMRGIQIGYSPRSKWQRVFCHSFHSVDQLFLDKDIVSKIEIQIFT